MTDTIPTIDELQLNSFGIRLFGSYQTYQTNRVTSGRVDSVRWVCKGNAITHRRPFPVSLPRSPTGTATDL